MAAADPDVVTEHRFRVMASEAHVIIHGPAATGATLATRIAPRRLGELEQHWSRFIPTSDLRRLADTSGGLRPVHPDTVTLVEAMREGAIATVGRYDPTLAPQLAAAGHRPKGPASAWDRPLTPTSASIHDVEIDRDGCRIGVPAGLTLDPGGVGKGLAADLLAAELCAAGAAGALVAIGGDLAARGTAPDPGGWIITIERPDDPAGVIGRIAIDTGGVATSSTRSNRWIIDGHEAHHVIDPESGAVSTTDLAAVTVIAPTGWQAEVHATAALLEGSAGAIAYLEARSLDGLAVSLDGTVLATETLQDLGSGS